MFGRKSVCEIECSVVNIRVGNEVCELEMVGKGKYFHET